MYIIVVIIMHICTIYIYYYVYTSHLACTFSKLHMNVLVYIFTVHAFPGSQVHDVGIANNMLIE